MVAIISLGFPGGASGEESAGSTGDVRAVGLIPGSGRSPGEGSGSPLPSSCLGSPVDRGNWKTI